MAKWDVTTAEGCEALERFLMERMGFQRKDGVWVHKDGGHVDEGWLFGGDGMVWAKEWAAKEYEWEIGTRVFAGSARAYIVDWGGYEVCNEVEAEDEPAAVALALARALEEMEGAEER